MQVKQEFKKAIATAKQEREKIAKIKEKYARLTEAAREYNRRGMSTERALNMELEALDKGMAEEIGVCVETIRQIGREASRIGKEEGALNAKMIDADTLALLDSGVKLTAGEWQELADKNRHSPTMTRILKDRYSEHPVMIHEENSLIDGGTEHPAEIHFAQTPMQRAEIVAKFCESVARGAETGVYLDGFANQDSYWNHRAIEAMNQIENEEYGDLSADFPVEYAKPKFSGDIW